MNTVCKTGYRYLIVLFITGCCTLMACKEKSGTANAQTAKPPKTDLHTAIMTDNLEALKQHISSGSDLNVKDPIGGSSPLISAALFGKTEMARLLINAGANLNFQNNDGSTALHTAAFFCRVDIVKLLLQARADKTLKNKYGQTAYQTVEAPFSDVKKTYDMIGKLLEPLGIKFDYPHIEKTRPGIAALLK